ncbi:uncharacterized protein N7511_007592 [Penicillium nucicola]|uniref:uncharacterized protein n=1 Tax=Penicillium nucicola TaxID=1850975 RepID=UPI0025455F0B|nr:uncharacterized protein N7511_007592 [Penicillium nucicola]KAJ5753439.1 hypothetical protein N7511_007592 [Penicillium nucicola]
MFAHLVTAAKGLFTRPENTESADSNMVTTRRGEVAPELANGKRKANKADNQQTKRRRKSDPKDMETEDASDILKSSNLKGEKAPAEKKNHFRFDSEEPEIPETLSEEIPEDPMQEDEDEDSDDDAPEAIDNSAQLLRMKEQAKKRETAKQLEEQLKREKRRKLDERRKLQAKTIVKPKESSDDLLSESTATIQGTTTQDARRAALPALLPDDILNAEPVIRPPTPPADEFAMPKKSNKLRFLDKQDKIPKDVNLGDISIRVLDAPSTKKSSKPALAPRVSKAGKNLKSSMLQRARSSAGNGLRKKASGPGGFVRR